ncbi:MAG: hypothetical protein ACOY5W_09180 [Pseudomonadota bacterium]
MTIIKQDSFSTAAPPELLSAHTSDVGGGYQGDLLAHHFSIDPSGILLCSNDARKSAYGTENPATTDYEAEVTGRTIDTDPAGQFGCCVRASGGGESAMSGYSAVVHGDGTVSLARYNGGVRTNIGSPYTISGFTPATLYTLKLRAEGTDPVSVSVYLNDTLVIAHSDSDVNRIVAAGNGGVFSRKGALSRSEIYTLLVQDLVGGGGGNTAPTVDSFVVEDASVVDTTVITISSFTGSDAEDINPAGYAITESTTPPASSQSATPIAAYDLGSYRSATLYPWVFDSQGQVSALYGSPVQVIAVSSLGGGTTIIFGTGFGGGITS